jgi:ssDNA-binding Zn-finger/Zn-ribbon topoisomerase 1
MVCVSKCPEDAIVVDERFPVCNGHGCPLHSNRLAGTACSVWQDNCPTCGTTLWRAVDSTEWACPKCDDGRKVSCPKTRLLEIVPRPGQAAARSIVQ